MVFPRFSEVKFPEKQNYCKGQDRAQNFRSVWYVENIQVTQLLILSFYEVSLSLKISTPNSRLVSIVGNKFVYTHCVSLSLQRCASMKGNKDIALILCDCSRNKRRRKLSVPYCSSALSAQSSHRLRFGSYDQMVGQKEI